MGDKSMDKYEIKYIENSTDNENINMNICAAMVLGKNENEINLDGNFHRMLYGKYLAGFAFEGYNLLPPLCILQNIENNAVYYNDTIYDPKLGIFSVSEYAQQNINISSYVQIFIPEAYEGIEWCPYIPVEIQSEFEKNKELEMFFHNLPSMQQSKILNYIHPFSKPSSFKENRTLAQPIKPTNIQQIILHIKSLMDRPQNTKSPWEELTEFETIEAVETLKKCGITEGMTVLDMGCGHGHYTYAASIATGTNGKVFAVDMDKKVLNYVENRAKEFNLNNITSLKTNEKGFSEYTESIDFIILYDVLHGLFNFTKADWGTTTKLEFIEILVSLLKNNGILSLALYDEIEHKKIPVKTKDGTDSFKSEPIPHDEAIQPYIELMQASGLKLHSIIENGGVHFDDFHNPSKWRKFCEIKVSSLDRRNIYNFIKV
jgi:2-polyprenyl-3-methyl-5-hydroxy-6-metoxy-1,4-benzoquinol methylase